MIEVISIDTPALGDRSYLATDGRVALVVDPQRDIDRVLAAAAARGVRITHVFETHIHNDYVSGGLALARVTGAAYHVNADDEVAFDRTPVTDGDAIAVGDTMLVQVIATPGHTFTHLSYALQDTASGHVTAVFTGGSLIPWGTPLTLLGDTPEQVAAAQRDLARIGIDQLAGAATGTPQDWAGGQPLASFPVASFADLTAVRHHRPVIVLDVRRALEWADSHLDGALHIPLQDLPARIGEVPPGEVWVHCRSGYRAVIAASLLQAAGHPVVAVDDEFTRAGAAGLALAAGRAA